MSHDVPMSPASMLKRRGEMPTLRRMVLCSTAGLVLICLAGCSSSIYGWQVRTNTSEVAASFTPNQLQERPVAVFGAVAPPALRGNEVHLSYYLEDILKKVVPGWNVLSSEETVSRINAHGLTE